MDPSASADFTGITESRHQPINLANARRILGCQSAGDGGVLQAARLLMVIYAFALVASKLPVQLLSSRWYLVDAERSRLQAFQNQQQLISKRLQAASTIASLNALIPPPPSQANATLQQRRTAITDALASDQNNLRRRLASESRQRLMQLLINGLRILVTALATALFFRMLAQTSDQLLARSLKEK